MTELSYLKCMSCGKQVSTGFIPEPTNTPDKGIIIRAYIECPECIGKEKINAQATVIRMRKKEEKI